MGTAGRRHRAGRRREAALRIHLGAARRRRAVCARVHLWRTAPRSLPGVQGRNTVRQGASSAAAAGRTDRSRARVERTDTAQPRETSADTSG
eukprot:5549015-Prymnesium_polylepis.1